MGLIPFKLLKLLHHSKDFEPPEKRMEGNT